MIFLDFLEFLYRDFFYKVFCYKHGETVANVDIVFCQLNTRCLSLRMLRLCFNVSLYILQCQVKHVRGKSWWFHASFEDFYSLDKAWYRTEFQIQTFFRWFYGWFLQNRKNNKEAQVTRSCTLYRFVSHTYVLSMSLCSFLFLPCRMFFRYVLMHWIH